MSRLRHLITIMYYLCWHKTTILGEIARIKLSPNVCEINFPFYFTAIYCSPLQVKRSRIQKFMQVTPKTYEYITFVTHLPSILLWIKTHVRVWEQGDNSKYYFSFTGRPPWHSSNRFVIQMSAIGQDMVTSLSALEMDLQESGISDRDQNLQFSVIHFLNQLR